MFMRDHYYQGEADSCQECGEPITLSFDENGCESRSWCACDREAFERIEARIEAAISTSDATVSYFED